MIYPHGFTQQGWEYPKLCGDGLKKLKLMKEITNETITINKQSL